MNLKCILKTRKNPYGETLYGEKLDSFESYTLCDSLRELCALCGEKMRGGQSEDWVLNI